MKIIEINVREFRKNQKKYFDLADSGEKIIITKGDKNIKKSYLLTPIVVETIIPNEELTKIDDVIKGIKDNPKK